jgi:hypothetical protein
MTHELDSGESHEDSRERGARRTTREESQLWMPKSGNSWAVAGLPRKGFKVVFV